jgi:ribonuclease HII
VKISIGLDEAGRGCVLGPLIVGLVAFESNSDEKYFKNLGVKDSKQLTPEKRSELFAEIVSHCFYHYHYISTEQIDSENLNLLEFNSMVSLASYAIEKYIDADINIPEFEIYIDCPEQDQKQHSTNIRNKLSHSWNVNVTSEHKGDDKYIVVGSSSIVAKVLRDREMHKIANIYFEEYGDIGSGYPGDWRTKKFLEDYYSKNKSFPKETRMKWGTVEKIRKNNCENSEFDWQGSPDDLKNG